MHECVGLRCVWVRRLTIHTFTGYNVILCVLAAGKSCVAIPKLHNHVLAADSSSFSLSTNKLLLISSTFVWAPEAKGRVNSTPAEGKRYRYSYQS